MKSLFDDVSFASSRLVTQRYSTSFASAVKMLAPCIRQDIYNIYGFVRVADEIVDSFHDFDKAALFARFGDDLERCLRDGISTNPILNSFQHTVAKYEIPTQLISSFMKSMEADLTKKEYASIDEYRDYIYGSADVVGLMCLKVFVKGDDQKYEALKDSAMRLGSAFQKVNFLRDLKMDFEQLDRSYFPGVDLTSLDENVKSQIVEEIEADLRAGLQGVLRLPIEAKLGVYVAYCYYRKLLVKLKNTPPERIRNARIRVPNYQKFGLFAKCYINCKLNIV
ncbi:MAG: phytoene/squalene synthase family protein [Flavobacterium sp.]|uniref:phytoene/squalene synthase family protein n=1 Tax=Flavobacterium sp. TaxID=239 RepID=UPI0012200FBD|nr:phytoene/squalene synthase family protein [Flavobacterium sp.]RZJ66252.1 MAG: phytoene/squalene synthase family protein [Flavobacterium sp.]